MKTISRTNIFGDSMSDRDSVASRLRDLKVTIDALQSQLDRGVDPAEVNRQLLDAMEDAKK